MPKATPKTKSSMKVAATPKTPRNLEKSLREPKKAAIIEVADYLSESETEEKPSPKKKRRVKKGAVAITTPASATPTPGIKKSTRNLKVSDETTKEQEETKINAEIKKELLADWSDDEVGTEEKSLIETNETTAKKNIPENTNDVFDDLKKNDEAATATPIKCRNIPKKRERDFVFEAVQEDVFDEKKQQVEDKKRLKEEEKLKREEEKQKEIERMIKEKVEKQKEKEEKRKKQEEKRKQQLEEKRKMKEEKKKQQELKKKEEEVEKQALLENQKAEAVQRKAEVERRKQEEEQKRLEEEKKKVEAKKKVKGDFDLLMEQLEETPPPVRVSRRNKNKSLLAETPVKQTKTEPVPLDKNKSTRKSSRHSEASKSEEPEIGEDEALAQEIKELLKETDVPTLGKEVDNDERKLPPKERGKRIFKEAQQVKNPKNLTSPLKAMTESELLIAETLTQLPQTAIQFSPKKTVPNKGSTSNVNDVAESLINLSTPPRPVSSVYESPISNSSLILNPRKRHLRALEEKTSSVSALVKEDQIEPKHEHLTKRQRKIEAAQHAKTTETPNTLETRLPKKRKAEYQSEFESVVNLKREDDKKITVIHEQKIISSTSQQKVDESLFDINNMEILFDNELTSKVRPMTKSSGPSSAKIISSSSSKMTIVRSEPQIIQIKQDSRLQRISPIPQNSEIRRLSFPNTGTKEQKLLQEVTPTHRKVMKLITQSDGTKTLIEEVQPNLSRNSPTTSSTHSLIVRASSSSPLAKSQRSMTQSPTGGTPKPQVIVGRASNKILITSKGSLMTTTSTGKGFHY